MSLVNKKYSNYLNVGCGKKYHKEWTNIDMVSDSPFVLQYNLVKGLPFKEDEFNVVYHSQVLEHIPKEKASFFIAECYRVLKPGGILRVVVPDLENIAKEYLKQLDTCLSNPSPVNQNNYDWIMLEFFDQTVRNKNGGEMQKFLLENLTNKEYVLNRIGLSGENVIFKSKNKESLFSRVKKKGLWKSSKLAIQLIQKKILSSLIGKKYVIGDFRLSGEIHNWMYDRFSLGQLLEKEGFKNIKVVSADESIIPDWDTFELDKSGNKVYDPTSLFIEAQK